MACGRVLVLRIGLLRSAGAVRGRTVRAHALVVRNQRGTAHASRSARPPPRADALAMGLPGWAGSREIDRGSAGCVGQRRCCALQILDEEGDGSLDAKARGDPRAHACICVCMHLCMYTRSAHTYTLTRRMRRVALFRFLILSNGAEPDLVGRHGTDRVRELCLRSSQCCAAVWTRSTSVRCSEASSSRKPPIFAHASAPHSPTSRLAHLRCARSARSRPGSRTNPHLPKPARAP